MTTDTVQNEIPAPEKRLGKLPARGDPRLLAFARFAQLDKIPAAYDPWKRRSPFPARSYGNRNVGDCTRASQAVMMTRLERVETSRTPSVTDDEVLRVYYDMTQRRYGGGDTGAYEIDALSDWRNPETTFKDPSGHPLTIDAYTAVNHRDVEQVKAAIALSGKFGVKLCLNLPLAFSRIDPPAPWDVSDGQPLTGDWMPGSWGGHSLFADSYDKTGVRLCHTWWDGGGVVYQQTLTWAGLAAYCDEMYWILDSVDAWRKRTAEKVQSSVDLAGLVKAVNRISGTKIKR